RGYRLLVVDGRLAGVLENRLGRLVGDGARTIAALAAAANRGPPRGGPRPSLPPLALTPEILAHLALAGRDADTIPAAGEVVELHWHGHLSRGSVPAAVDGAVHPDNRKAACQAARVVGLDVAGIDL